MPLYLFTIVPLLATGPLAARACAAEPDPAEGRRPSLSIERQEFGETSDGEQVSLYTCTNEQGLVLKLTDYGATIVSLEVPDRDGQLENITLGFSCLSGYLQQHPYFGVTVGRYCNRIAGGQFALDGQQYTLARNNDENHLHGGERGFDKHLWDAEIRVGSDTVGVCFSRRSPDGEEGYPGNLDVTATYLLTNSNELKIVFTATTDQPTPVNLTNHSYWNLGGAGSGTILDHQLMIVADKYLPVDEGLIPTGELARVDRTPLDFTTPTSIGARIEEIDADPVGYDHCFVLRNASGDLELAARAKDPESGRVMEVYTTQPGMQFYSGNFLDGSPSSGGYDQYEGFCLETQHFPDSPNQPDFPSTILQPDDEYHQVTVYKFSAE